MHRIVFFTPGSVLNFLLMIMFTILITPVTLSGKNYEVEFKCGVSREVLDYEDDTSNPVIRGGSSVTLYDSFNFDITTLRNIDNKTSSYTWNINLRDISGFLNFTAGNYNLHFGSGLMMGKQAYIPKDPFTKKISISKEKTISPANGGNPEYSFYGTVFDFHKLTDDAKIYFIPFVSSQRRYITPGSFESGTIDSSIFTLNSKIRKEGNYTEPVNIINYGCVAGLQASALFNIQIYSFATDIRGDSGKKIRWDADAYNGGSGISLIRNSGLFAEYADKNISLFVEPAVSSISNGITLTDFAVAWGIGIQNSILNFAARGKNCGENFHSEYSTGSRTPERIWETRCGIFPVKHIETGFIVYGEKNLLPSYHKDYIEGSTEEEVFTAVNTGSSDINLNFKRREHYSTDRKDPLDQCNLTAGFSPVDRLYLKFRSSAQKSSGGTSYLAGGDIKLLFLNYLSLSLGYTRIVINSDMPLYAVITPATEHSSITPFRESAHGGSVNFRYKKERDSFYIRFTTVKTSSGSKGDIESALTLLF